MAGSRRRRWSLAEDQALMDHYKIGSSSYVIEKAIQRSRSQIWQRAHFMGITRKQEKGSAPVVVVHGSQKARKCLTCSEMFASEWIGNRICSRCSHSPEVYA